MNMGKRFLITLLSLFLFAGSAFAYGNPRWFNMPVSVYIQKSNNTASVTNAFKAWQGASGGTLRFIYRNSKNLESLSNITVSFVDLLPNEDLYKVTPEYSTFGKAHYSTENGFYYKNHIVIARRSSNGKLLSSSQIYALALRAVGEAVGIKPIDTNTSSVMSKTTNILNNRTITKSDINALYGIYKK